MAKSIHMLYKNIEVILACVQQIRGDLVCVHGIPSDHFASTDMTVALNSLLEAKRIIKHIDIHGDNEISDHTTKHMKSIIDDVIWGISSVQHHVDRDEHRFDGLTSAILDSINELNKHIFCVDDVYSVSSTTHDIEVTTKVLSPDSTPELSASEKSIFDELVDTLFKRPTIEPKKNVWAKSGNPLSSRPSSGLSSGWGAMFDTMVETPGYRPFISSMSNKREQVCARPAKERNDKTRFAFHTTQPLLSGLPSSSYNIMVMDFLVKAVVTYLKEEESTVTVEDWHTFVENVNSKL